MSKGERGMTFQKAEAISLREMPSWITELQYDHCIFKTDSKHLVVTCNGRPGRDFFGTIIGGPDLVQSVRPH